MENLKKTNRTLPLVNGFTLIELLVVVAIIAVLIALLLPSLSRARETAKQVVCMSNFRQIGVVVWNYQDDNNSILPSQEFNGRSVNTDALRKQTWQWKIMESMKCDPKIFKCLSTDYWGQMGSFGPQNYCVSTTYQWAVKINMDRPKNWGDPLLRSPDKMLYMVDSECSHMVVWTNDLWQFTPRHSGKANVLCLDMHVQGGTGWEPYINGNDTSAPAYFFNLYPYKSK